MDSRTDTIRGSDSPASAGDNVPLVVDVDGTLLRTDLLVESAILLLTSDPVAALNIPIWLSAGKPRLKAEIADRVDVDVENLPLDPAVMAFAQSAKRDGRRVYLASASDRRLVEAIARRLGFIDGIFATERDTPNLSGARKRDVLVQTFGEGGYDYVADARTDIPVWEAARKSYVVRRGLVSFVPRRPNEDRSVSIQEQRPAVIPLIAKALRLNQWAKNLLLFVPLVLGGAAGNDKAIVGVGACFVILGILASSTYLLNDVVDLASDRRHASKRFRPLASGNLSLSSAIVLSAIGIGTGLGLGVLLGLPVFVALVGYLVATLAYSWRLKRMPVADVSLLAGLYTWRLFLGVLVSGVALSPWLMVFSFAFFLSLSMAKRYSEIISARDIGDAKLPGRGYRKVDAPFVMAMGIAAAVSSILIFVLYLIEGAFRAAFFTTPQLLWACPVVLLLWLCRIWLICGRGELDDDPVEFAIRDRKSLVLGGIAVVVVSLSLFA